MSAVQIENSNHNILSLKRELARFRAQAERDEARIQRRLYDARLLDDRTAPVPNIADFIHTPREEMRRLFMEGEIGKYGIMRITGYLIEQARPNGWSVEDFNTVLSFILGKINIWTRAINDDNYDDMASIRSLIYEMSPSSMQHYFKYGKPHLGGLNPPGLNTPICFVNKELANKNEEYEWRKVDGSGTGRNTKAVRRCWHFVDNLDKNQWNVVEYGPLPRLEHLREASDDRAKGDRSWANA